MGPLQGALHFSLHSFCITGYHGWTVVRKMQSFPWCKNLPAFQRSVLEISDNLMDFLMDLTSVQPWEFQEQHRRRGTVAIAHGVQSWACLQICDFALCPNFCYKLQEEWTTGSCGKCGQHQGNRDQIFKVMWLQNVPAWEGNYYFREYICSNSKSFCSTSYVPPNSKCATVLDILLQPNVTWRAGWVC